MESTNKGKADLGYRNHEQDAVKELEINEHKPPHTRSIHTIQSHTAHANNTISLRDVLPVSVRLSHLSISVDVSSNAFAKLFSKNKASTGQRDVKNILDDVSTDIRSGTITAILGGSGSSKTTLLNSMSGRMKATSGCTLFNGTEDISSIKSAYVIQQDILLPTLTVRETLTYAAQLRLPASVTQAERKQLVEEVIAELSLKEAAETRIGNHAHKGCSGGEKRRTSIGVQLLSNPSVLWLDEPTTGLDSTSAYQVIKTLQNLARQGRTIIVTIHQPRSEIWSLFDNVILLTRGSPAYAGSAKDCLDYFAKLGHEMPPFTNPAEYLIDVVSVDNRSKEAEAVAEERVQRIKAAWRQHCDVTVSEKQQQHVVAARVERNPRSLAPRHSSMLQQIRVLTSRTWVVTIRDPMGMFGSLLEAISMAIITGWIFLHVDGSLSGIRSRQGALYNAAALQGYLILLFETYRLTDDIQLFDEEARQGVVSIPAFLISRRFARFFIEDLPVPLFFSVIYYFMVGFRADVGQFLTFFSVILLQHYIAVCFATVCVAVSRNFAGASLVANLAYTLQSMACGYFIQSNTIPIYVRWTKWTAYVFYAFGALCANEFTGSFYDCPVGGSTDEACKEYTGDFIMDSLGFPNDWVWRPILALTGYIFAFYAGAAVLLRYWKAEIAMARARPSNMDASAGKEKMSEHTPSEVRMIDIRLETFGLDVEKRTLRSQTTKTILNPLTAEFRPGSLNVIMGPSGSGKTSLLNSMSGRLKDDFSTRYKTSGTMTFNGLAPSEDVVHSICSFVPQDDDALLASLTVRETLCYAAGLRLPKWMSKQQKTQKAEETILKMGLKDCADNLIGNDLVKGISGGEKRRVTIAVQILTEPRILLLDEPLSGLDAFTALSIMDVLLSLAHEGRTLIVTIHQPRTDLFDQFGNIMLLARGGHPVFAGPASQMLPHFAAQGYDCPLHVNPADFALDLITVDLQHLEREEASREKVRKLVEAWHPDLVPTTRIGSIATPAELGSLAREPASFAAAYPILIRRATKNFFRMPDLIIARVMQVVGLGIVLALFFAPLKNDYFSIQNRMGFLIEIAPLYFVGMLNNIATYPVERDVFYRDYDDRIYGVEAFFLTYISITTPFEIISCFVFAVLAVLAVGLERDATTYFVITFNAFCITSCGESLGIAFNTLFMHTGFSVNIMSVFLSVAQVMGGVISLNIPSFLQAFNHLSPVKWAIGNMAPYTLRDLQFTCEDWQKINGQCPITTGQQVLELYKLDKDPGIYIMALGICAIVYRFLAYVVLKCVKERWVGRLWKEIGGGKKNAPAGTAVQSRVLTASD
ncbi:P-loop containing nucleoside triphosphate hydrolase protein [Didymella exigua CBS 183.55]|uniref:P-loop containing nucleoside triphosphate hydrolase protein n=1 Tax=Didymella exigua CBS 183.55 TaxID=1150837 RepID=A0A6A5RSW7_9PLEO|nr:P-loop containing nucleoside triphosphate hydrolase protein [Didymella exigua CBS 183.55]KAF1931515.1 P-loop containing nucleoside triphosphate hydrolase protein [Didymella exigua CBS 183.55]